MTPWDALRARLDAGEPVTLEEIVRTAATAPLPANLRNAKLRREQPKRPRGRPRKWTERDIRTVENLCSRIAFWSEALGGEELLPADIQKRVGLLLGYDDPGKEVARLLRRGRERYGSRRGMMIFRDEDFRRVLGSKAPEVEWTNHLRLRGQ
jgi:hypothetical protein